MKDITLLVSDEILERFFKQADTRKQSVMVDREALNQLLIDYNRMHEALRSSGSFTVTTPKAPKRARAMLK